MNGVVLTQSWSENPLNASHNLPPVDRAALIDETLDVSAAADGGVDLGVLLKESGGKLTPWIQGTDAASAIVAVHASNRVVDPAKDTTVLKRVFGPVRKEALKAWTAADGSTTAAPSAAAFAQLESLNIFAL